jgi:hypothetical protein
MGAFFIPRKNIHVPHHVASINKAQGAIESLDPRHRAAGRLHSLERCGKDCIEFRRTMSRMVEIDAWLVVRQPSLQ